MKIEVFLSFSNFLDFNSFYDLILREHPDLVSNFSIKGYDLVRNE